MEFAESEGPEIMDLNRKKFISLLVFSYIHTCTNSVVFIGTFSLYFR